MHTFKHKYLFLVALFLATFQLQANEPVDVFQSANEAYQAGNFDQAITAYEQLIMDGLVSTELHYNLANAYYNKKEIGKAILNYERALILKPSNKDAQYNLQLVRKKELGVEKLEDSFFLTRWWNGLRQIASSRTWAWLGLILIWLAGIAWTIWIMGKNRVQKKKGFLIGIGSFLFSLIPFALAYHSLQLEENSQRAIVIERTAELFSRPDDQSTQLNQLPEGTTVKILDEIGAWQKIQLQNGIEGFLSPKALEKI